MTPGGDTLAMEYSPDGQQLATAGSSGAVAIYDVGSSPTNYSLDSIFPAHERPVRYLHYLSATEMVTVGEDGLVKTWDLTDTGQPRRVYSHDAVIKSATLPRWPPRDRRQRWRYPSPSIWRATWCGGGDRFTPTKSFPWRWNETSVLSGGADKTVILSHRTDGALDERFPGYAEPVISVGFRRGDASLQFPRTSGWWNGTKFRPRDRISTRPWWRLSCPMSPMPLHLTDGRMYITTGSALQDTLDLSGGGGGGLNPGGGSNSLTGLAEEDSGGKYRSTTWVYDENGLLLTQIEHDPREGRVRAVTVYPTDTYILTGKSTVVYEQQIEGAGLLAAFIAPQIIVSEFHSVQFWHRSRGSYSGSLEHNRSIDSARITQDGKWAFTQSAQRVFRWGLEDGVDRNKFLETGYYVPHQFDELRMSGDADGTVVTRVGPTIFLMDIERRLLRMSVHTDSSTYDISSDGDYLITNGEVLRFWDVGVDFPTVVHENPKDAKAVAFMPQGSTGRIRDSLIGTDDVNLGNDSEMPWEPFLGIHNRTDQPDPLVSGGAQFSGITLPIPGGTECDAARWTEIMAVSRNQNRCAVVAQAYARTIMGCAPTGRAYIYVLDLTERLSPQLLRTIPISAAGGQAAVALSDDGRLLFYGGWASGKNDMAQGTLYDIDRGLIVHTFAPPSIGSMSNRGPAAAQFTRNDGALMIAWREGYASIYERQGLQGLEVEPSIKSVSPGQTVNLKADALYVDGSKQNVTTDAQWSLGAGAAASIISGAEIKIDASATPGSEIVVNCSYEAIDGMELASAMLMVREPTFLELTADPARTLVSPGEQVTYHFFAQLADGTSIDVTDQTVVTVQESERASVTGNVVNILPGAQFGFLEVRATCVLDGDERSVSPIIQIRSPFDEINPGDFNADLDVDFADLLYLIGHYLETTSSPNWDARGDFNGDGRIDFTDVNEFIALYGTVYAEGKSKGRGGVPDVREKGLEKSPVHLWLEGPAEDVRVGKPLR